MRIVLEFDDFHFLDPENCVATIARYVEAIPNIKITLFTTPRLRKKPIYTDKNWCKKVSKLEELGIIEICHHGLDHSHLEFSNLNKDEAIKKIAASHHIFNCAKINFKKIFRAPNWGINIETIEALNEFNYTHLYNHENYRHLESIFHGRTAYYNWNLSDDFNIPPGYNEPIIAHGHTHNVCRNGIEETFEKTIVKLVELKANYIFASEV